MGYWVTDGTPAGVIDTNLVVADDGIVTFETDGIYWLV